MRHPGEAGRTPRPSPGRLCRTGRPVRGSGRPTRSPRGAPRALRLRDHRRRPGRRGGCLPRALAGLPASPSSIATCSAARARTGAACHPSRSERGRGPRGGRRLPVAAGVRPARLHDQPGRPRLPRRHRSRAPAWWTRAPTRSAARVASTARAASSCGTTTRSTSSRPANVVLAVGSETKMPPIEGIGAIRTWTNRDATGARELPASLLVLGGGPTGVELAQVYARFGVPVTIVQSGLAPDPDRSSAQLRGRPPRDAARRRRGPPGRARRPRPAGGVARRARQRSSSTTGAPPTGHAVLLAVGRTIPLGRARARDGGRRGGHASPTTDGSGCRTACTSSVTVPGRSSTRTRRTTRASWRSGWRSATTSSPTTARCPGRRTRTRSWRRSG